MVDTGLIKIVALKHACRTRQLNLSRDGLFWITCCRECVTAVITEERTGHVALAREMVPVFTSPSKEESKILAE
jgi:hypothetical protein